MSRTKRILILPLVFVLACIASFFMERVFAQMVRYFYSSFTHHKLYFTGKYFRLFPSDAFILSFGICCVVFTALMFRHTFKQGLYRALLVLVLFFLSVALICDFNATMYIIACTACKGGRRAMSARDVKYDVVFISGLVIALLPMVIAEMTRWFKKRPVNGRFRTNQLVKR